MPTFDIITPAYNAAHYLPAALDSVLAQSFKDWRIILVDDGSTDATRAVVETYQRHLGDKLVYLWQPNAGMSAARNTAIRNASAEFLAMLDADDIWLPNRLESTLKRFEANPQIGLTYGFIRRIDPQGNVIDTFDRRNAHAEGKVAPYLYMRTLDMPCPTISFRRQCLEKAGVFDETMGASEDRDVWIRITSHYDAALIPEIIAHYRQSPQGVSKNIDRMTNAQLRLVNKHYGAPGCGWLARRVALSWVYRERAEALAAKGQLAEALNNAVRAAGYSPWQVRTLRALGSMLLRFSRSRRSPAPRVAS